MRSQADLFVPARRVPAARLPAAQSRLGYLRGAVASPMCVAVALFAACLGIGYAGFVGAVVATVIVLALGVIASRYRAVRGYLDEQTRLQARAERHCRRLRQVRKTNPARLRHYEELRVMVDEIERLDPIEAERFELQDLLDHLIKLALGHQRCVDALRLAGADALPTPPPLDATRSSRRAAIIQRRIRHRDDCVRWMAQITDEIEGIDQLIRLAAQRTAGPSEVELDREIDRRLWEIDEVDAAMHQLSA
jgi:heme exporter protein D